METKDQNVHGTPEFGHSVLDSYKEVLWGVNSSYREMDFEPWFTLYLRIFLSVYKDKIKNNAQVNNALIRGVISALNEQALRKFRGHTFMTIAV